MWVKSENPNLEQIFYRGFMDEPLVFSDNGKAQTTSKIGKKLVEKVGDIKPVEEGKSDEDEKPKEVKKKISSDPKDKSKFTGDSK